MPDGPHEGPLRRSPSEEEDESQSQESVQEEVELPLDMKFLVIAVGLEYLELTGTFGKYFKSRGRRFDVVNDQDDQAAVVEAIKRNWKHDAVRLKGTHYILTDTRHLADPHAGNLRGHCGAHVITMRKLTLNKGFRETMKNVASSIAGVLDGPKPVKRIVLVQLCKRGRHRSYGMSWLISRVLLDAGVDDVTFKTNPCLQSLDGICETCPKCTHSSRDQMVTRTLPEVEDRAWEAWKAGCAGNLFWRARS